MLLLWHIFLKFKCGRKVHWSIWSAATFYFLFLVVDEWRLLQQWRIKALGSLHSFRGWKNVVKVFFRQRTLNSCEGFSFWELRRNEKIDAQSINMERKGLILWSLIKSHTSDISTIFPSHANIYQVTNNARYLYRVFILLYYFHYTAKFIWVRLLSRSMKFLPPKRSIFCRLVYNDSPKCNQLVYVQLHFYIELNNEQIILVDTSYLWRYLYYAWNIN